MRRKMCLLCGVTMVTGWQIGACVQALPLIPINVPLSGGLASFQVEGGTPAKSTGTASFDNGGINIGRGNIELDPSVITITPTPAGSGKRSSTTAQDTEPIQSCQDACGVAGLAAADCTKICQDQTLRVTLWLDTAENSSTVCDNGTQFGPFDVTLVNGVPTTVSPSTVNIQGVLGLLNSGSFSICIEVISPIAGTVTIGGLTFNVGL